jgi:hypothetical protein
MRKNLTGVVVTKSKPPAAGQLDIFDLALPSFGLRVGARSRSYFLIYRAEGRLRRMKSATPG